MRHGHPFMLHKQKTKRRAGGDGYGDDVDGGDDDGLNRCAAEWMNVTVGGSLGGLKAGERGGLVNENAGGKPVITGWC